MSGWNETYFVQELACTSVTLPNTTGSDNAQRGQITGGSTALQATGGGSVRLGDYYVGKGTSDAGPSVQVLMAAMPSIVVADDARYRYTWKIVCKNASVPAGGTRQIGMIAQTSASEEKDVPSTAYTTILLDVAVGPTNSVYPQPFSYYVKNGLGSVHTSTWYYANGTFPLVDSNGPRNSSGDHTAQWGFTDIDYIGLRVYKYPATAAPQPPTFQDNEGYDNDTTTIPSNAVGTTYELYDDSRDGVLVDPGVYQTRGNTLVYLDAAPGFQWDGSQHLYQYDFGEPPPVVTGTSPLQIQVQDDENPAYLEACGIVNGGKGDLMVNVGDDDSPQWVSGCVQQNGGLGTLMVNVGDDENPNWQPTCTHASD